MASNNNSTYIEYNMLENDERLPAITLPISLGLKERRSHHKTLFLPLHSIVVIILLLMFHVNGD